MSSFDADVRDAACLLAIDPHGLRGAIVTSTSMDTCEGWVDAFIPLLPDGAPVRRIPSSITDDRLIGGLDVAATLAAGRPVCERGVLTLADGGIVITNGSTLHPTTLSRITSVLDAGEVLVERDGVAQRHAASFAVISMQVLTDDARISSALADRAAFIIDMSSATRAVWSTPLPVDAVVKARAALPHIECGDDALVALCWGADALGVASTRVTMLAVAAARASAALYGRDAVAEEDLARAARLVLAPRATAAPPREDTAPSESATGNAEPQAPATRPQDDGVPGRDDGDRADVEELAEIVIRAASTALPPGVLSAAAAGLVRSNAREGRVGAEREGGIRGRQRGVRRGDPRSGARLDIIATLRVAAPFQRLRRNARRGPERLVELRRDDFRVKRHIIPTTTTTLFVVDVSGSAALHRLAEAKGAVELMLAEGYARRDRVALIAFRGTTAQLVLSPTHALARARRAIANLGAGGGTPLATALDLALRVVESTRRDGSQVAMVLLSDGRANVARDGAGGRARAEADALDSARRFRSCSGDAVFIDTAARPDPFARRLATELGARYLALPQAGAVARTPITREA